MITTLLTGVLIFILSRIGRRLTVVATREGRLTEWAEVVENRTDKIYMWTVSIILLIITLFAVFSFAFVAFKYLP